MNSALQKITVRYICIGLCRKFSLTSKFNYGFRLGELANNNSPADFILSSSYSLLKHFTFIAGVPVIVRKVRPDGLSKFATSFNYKISF
ncbi:MAG: hypothetical protein M0Q38_06335 [Bacteroidales bacterium]|nr:hypothetical protein [Bacteroidales bacterium]